MSKGEWNLGPLIESRNVRVGKLTSRTLNILSIHAISDKVIRKELYDAVSVLLRRHINKTDRFQITGQFPSDTGITNEFLSKESKSIPQNPTIVE